LLGARKRQARRPASWNKPSRKQARAGGALGKAKTHEDENDDQAKEKGRGNIGAVAF
jgi:hypothetical protein